jgi:hypothetical protein
MNFNDYNAVRPDENTVHSEVFSAPVTKTVVIALVMKTSELRQQSVICSGDGFGHIRSAQA